MAEDLFDIIFIQNHEKVFNMYQPKYEHVCMKIKKTWPIKHLKITIATAIIVSFYVYCL